jgi:hypothetical protein
MVFAGLSLPGIASADNKSKPAPPKKAPTPPALSPATKVEQAQVLCKAFVVMAGANHDYFGHRWNAMVQIKHALKLLDDQVMHDGNAAQKAAIQRGRQAVAQAEAAQAQLAMVNQPQPSSDARLKQAGRALAQLRPTLGRQPGVAEHVDNALREVAIALTKN